MPKQIKCDICGEDLFGQTHYKARYLFLCEDCFKNFKKFCDTMGYSDEEAKKILIPYTLKQIVYNIMKQLEDKGETK